MTVVISDEILQASEFTPGDFCHEIATHLFQTGRLTLGYASHLADMPLHAFRQPLKQRKIALYSSDEAVLAKVADVEYVSVPSYPSNASSALTV